jgi:uncharacterized protein (TIGR02757 family)
MAVFRKPTKRDLELREYFEGLYERYHRSEFLGTDPLVYVHRYGADEDREVVALLAAAFASGKIKSIQSVLEAILSVLGKHPAQWLRKSSPGELRGKFPGVYHRWVREEDLEVLLAMMGEALRQFGTLGELWQNVDEDTGEGIEKPLGRFVETILSQNVFPLSLRQREVTRKDGKVYALAPVQSILLTSPANGSACKRMHLFLRWMVREQDGVDLGVWNEFVSPERLMMPVDTHVLRICRKLRLTRQKTATHRAVEEITGRFRRISPKDPTRYDFSLVRAGIGEG